MSYQIALDVGGTFTDGILLDTASNRILVAKALTTPSDPGDGIAAVAESLVTQARAPESGFNGSISRVVHGTTLITNTLLERRGVPTALIVSEGTLDALDIRRELRYDIYDLAIEYPAPLVPPEARFAVRGRLGPGGQEWSALSAGDMSAAAAGIAEGGYEAVAVCLSRKPCRTCRFLSRARSRRKSASTSGCRRWPPTPMSSRWWRPISPRCGTA
jgi:N-methylhydantoinase A